MGPDRDLEKILPNGQIQRELDQESFGAPSFGAPESQVFHVRSFTPSSHNHLWSMMCVRYSLFFVLLCYFTSVLFVSLTLLHFWKSQLAFTGRQIPYLPVGTGSLHVGPVPSESGTLSKQG